MSDLSADLREKVIRALYQRATQLDWEHLGNTQRSEQYELWLEDPDIGGRLTQFMPHARARVWIKDVPMKEYGRARFGVGPLAHLIAYPRCTPRSVVRATLGSDWEPVAGTIAIKPAQCLAVGPDGAQRTVLWATHDAFKHLIWEALNVVATSPDRELSIALVEDLADPTGAQERERATAIAERCGLSVRYVSPAPGPDEAPATLPSDPAV